MSERWSLLLPRALGYQGSTVGRETALLLPGPFGLHHLTDSAGLQNLGPYSGPYLVGSAPFQGTILLKYMPSLMFGYGTYRACPVPMKRGRT